MKTRYDRPPVPEEPAALPDSEIDVSDIPETREDLWTRAKAVTPDGRRKAPVNRASTRTC